MSNEVKTEEMEELEDGFESKIGTEIEENSIDKSIDSTDSEQAEKNKGGRPSAYEPDYHNKVAHALARAGLSEDVIASEMGISRATMFNWKKKYPEFLDAITAGKADADDVVKASLYQRATGYDHKAVKIFMPANADEPIYAPYIEHVPPDVGAIKMWLTNRKPKEWKDKVDVSVDGNVSTIPDGLVEELSPEARAELAQAYARSIDKSKS